APGTPEDKVMELALDAGAEDVITDDEGVIEVVCAPADYGVVKQAFDGAGMKAEMDGIVMKALNETPLSGEDAEKMQKLLDVLESLDDVQEVYTTAVMDE
uniref:YebC/PmpR family DNA-binding transcriptional regulator n=1 Tax=Pigmentiphaga sp. TaxID=1977564 RepID=UPI0025D145F8